MNKEDIIKYLKTLGYELSNYTVEKIEEGDITFALVDIEDTIHDLMLLHKEIQNL